MGTQNDLANIQQIVDKLNANPVERFSYTEAALDGEIVDGVDSFDNTAEQNVPLAGGTDYDAMVLNKGIREQGASIPRMAWNHFLGRTSFNLNLLIRRLTTFFPLLRRFFAHNANEYDPQAEYRTGDVCFVVDMAEGLPAYTWYRRVSSSPTIISDVPPSAEAHWAPMNETTVIDLASDLTPLMDNTGSAGTSLTYARGDHVHPIDTSRAADNTVLTNEAALSTLPSSGTVKSIAQTIRNCLKWLVGRFDHTTGHVHDGVDSPKLNYSNMLGSPPVHAKTTTTPLMDGTAAIGSEMAWAAGNHVHPTDTSRAPINSPTFTGDPRFPADAVGSAASYSSTKAASEYQALLKVLYQKAQNCCYIQGDVSYDGSAISFNDSIMFYPVDKRIAPDGHISVTVANIAAGTVMPGLDGAPSVTASGAGTFVLNARRALVARHTPGGGTGAVQLYIADYHYVSSLQANDLIIFAPIVGGLVVGGSIFIPSGSSYSKVASASVYEDYRGITQLTGDVTAPSTTSGSAIATIATGAVTPAKMSVPKLSDITANLGLVSGTGATSDNALKLVLSDGFSGNANKKGTVLLGDVSDTAYLRREWTGSSWRMTALVDEIKMPRGISVPTWVNNPNFNLNKGMGNTSITVFVRDRFVISLPLSSELAGIMFSYDGITWESGGSINSLFMQSMAYISNKFVIFTGSNHVYYSADLLSFTKVYFPNNLSMSPAKMTLVDDKLMLVGRGYTLISQDGVSWTVLSYSTDNIHYSKEVYDIAYGNGVIMILMEHKSIYKSTNGITWEHVITFTKPDSSVVDVTVLTFIDGIFIVYNQQSHGQIFYSEDGVSWSTSTIPNVTIGIRITGAEGVFMCVNLAQLSTYVSTDLENWSIVASGIVGMGGTVPVEGFAFGNNKFIVVGTKQHGGTALASNYTDSQPTYARLRLDKSGVVKWEMS